MKRVQRWMLGLAIGGLCAPLLGNDLRDGWDLTDGPMGATGKARCVWADPFDWYTQWNYDNSQTWTDNRVSPFGGLHNGYYPAGSTTGTLPSRDGYCGSAIQNVPSSWEMVRGNWLTIDRRAGFLGNAIVTPAGLSIETGMIEANKDPKCGISGAVAPLPGYYGTSAYTWATGGTLEAMTMFTHNFSDRIAQAHPGADAVNGTDAHPLTLVFYIVNTLSPLKDNFYIELSKDGDHAPTDYVWRGNRDHNTGSDPESCPQGPYPVICQQVRELNASVSESEDDTWGRDMTWINSACPPLSTNTWQSFAFGFLAIMDKDPCGFAEQSIDKHCPTVDHYAYFDGNKWRQLRANREVGLATLPPCWDYGLDNDWRCPGVHTGLGGYDPNMLIGAGGSTNFAYPYGTPAKGSGMIRVYLKIITDYVLIYVWNEDGNLPSLSHEGAVVPRIYKGGFNTISIGVAPGCELNPDGTCKKAKAPLTYSGTFDGYNRKNIDGMLLIDGEPVSARGACCKPDVANTCEDNMLTADCTAQLGLFKGPGTVCTTTGPSKCCPKIYGDTNKDGVVDMTDFAVLQQCVTTGLSSPTVPDACSCLNSDTDTDIDSSDVEHFITCAKGPTVGVGTPAAGCLGRGW